MTICDDSGLFGRCTGVSNRAATERKKLASPASSQAWQADDNIDSQKLADALVARGRR